MAQQNYEAYHAPQPPAYPHPRQHARQAGPQELGPQELGPQELGPQELGPQDLAPPRVGRLVNLAGALVSVALLVGVGVWSYRLMVRDVSGVPVIRALAGPIRVSPEDPGGRQAAYQGLAVNTVAAQGEATAAARVIALAPPPVSLSEEDRAVAALAAQRQQNSQAGAAQSVASAAVSTPSTQAPSTQQIVAPPPVAATPAAPIPVRAVASAQAAAAEPPLTLVPATAPGVSRSPIPPARSAPTRVASAASAPGTDPQAEAVLQDLVTRLSAPSVNDIDPSTLAPGTRLVQLGAYDSADEARQAWNAMAARFPDYLAGRGRIIEAASAGGRTFFRLRAHGFVDEPEARRFCTVFLAENIDCIPVLIR